MIGRRADMPMLNERVFTGTRRGYAANTSYFFLSQSISGGESTFRGVLLLGNVIGVDIRNIPNAVNAVRRRCQVCVPSRRIGENIYGPGLRKACIGESLVSKCHTLRSGGYMTNDPVDRYTTILVYAVPPDASLNALYMAVPSKCNSDQAHARIYNVADNLVSVLSTVARVGPAERSRHLAAGAKRTHRHGMHAYGLNARKSHDARGR